MEISLKSIILFGSVLITGLSAGLFYAWSVSVIPGTQKVTDQVYLETMQSINRAILNPAFFLVFFGSVLMLGFSSIYGYQSGNLIFGFMLSAFACYFIGTVAVTGLGNVPLNDQLDALKLDQLALEEAGKFRKYYESRWNRLHQIRTAFAVLSFMLVTIGSLIQSQKL